MTDPIPARNQYALAALKDQRSRHAGEIAQLESQVRLKREALDHIDAVLKLFAPEIDPESLPARRARKGTPYPIDNLSRRILGVLRRRGEPMPCGEVIDALAAEMGFPENAAAVIADRVRYRLRDLKRREHSPVLKTGSRGDAMWSLR